MSSAMIIIVMLQYIIIYQYIVYLDLFLQLEYCASSHPLGAMQQLAPLPANQPGVLYHFKAVKVSKAHGIPRVSSLSQGEKHLSFVSANGDDGGLRLFIEK